MGGGGRHPAPPHPFILQNCVYEFSVVPRVLFFSNGSMHHCPKKNDLMKILEAIPPKEVSN